MTNERHDDWGDDGGLGPTLDAYAHARLRADAERTGIVRARVMAAARARSRAAATTAVPSTTPRRRLVLPRLARTPLLAAASLLLVAVLAGGVVAASSPGGPLYGIRLWAEELTLPSAPEERAAAEVDRLAERLAEASRAAEAGDADAVAAALAEYRATAEEALAAAGDNPERRAHVAEQIGRHVAVLAAIAERAPERAAAAIREAIGRTEAHIDELLAGEPGALPSPPTRPEATPKPEKSPPGKPEATPKPAKATPERPEATPKPDRTPPGKPEKTESPAP